MIMTKENRAVKKGDLIASDEYAKEGGDAHGDEHVDRGLLGPKTGIVSEEGEVGNLDAGVLDQLAESFHRVLDLLVVTQSQLDHGVSPV